MIMRHPEFDDKPHYRMSELTLLSLSGDETPVSDVSIPSYPNLLGIPSRIAVW